MLNPPSTDPLKRTTRRILIFCRSSRAVEINAVKLSALVDTASAITAISSSTIRPFDVHINSSSVVAFATANQSVSSSFGIVTLPIQLQIHSVELTCHVIDNLSHDLIVGYYDLKRLSATIDTVTNQIRFNDRNRTNPSPVLAVSSHRLPAQSHIFLTVFNPPNVCAFVQKLNLPPWLLPC
jgi:hypothetical protein